MKHSLFFYNAQQKAIQVEADQEHHFFFIFNLIFFVLFGETKPNPTQTNFSYQTNHRLFCLLMQFINIELILLWPLIFYYIYVIYLCTKNIAKNTFSIDAL